MEKTTSASYTTLDNLFKILSESNKPTANSNNQTSSAATFTTTTSGTTDILDVVATFMNMLSPQPSIQQPSANVAPVQTATPATESNTSCSNNCSCSSTPAVETKSTDLLTKNKAKIVSVFQLLEIDSIYLERVTKIYEIMNGESLNSIVNIACKDLDSIVRSKLLQVLNLVM